MAKIVKKQEVAVDKLKPYENNAKTHDADQVQKIADSITEFGFITPCLIDTEFNVIAGHGRLAAAKLLGMNKVPCVIIDGLTDTQRRAYILADNKLTELGGWDMELVSAELEALQGEGFDIDLTGFLVDDEIIDTDPIDDCGIGDEINELVAEPETMTHLGDVWQLGDHRLMCGDSTSLDDVLKLCADKLMDLLLTDPPYNVAVENAKGMTIMNDNMKSDAFYEFLLLALGNAASVLKSGGGVLHMARGLRGREFPVGHNRGRTRYKRVHHLGKKPFYPGQARLSVEARAVSLRLETRSVALFPKGS